MADGQVLIEISADNRDAKQTIRDTTHDLQNAAQKWEGTGNKMASVFAKIGAAIGAAKIGQALLNFGREAVEAASALEEVQNVVDVTFGDSARVIDDWAKRAITNFGLTETQAKQFASTIGAMAKSSGVAGDQIVTMSQDLAGLAADMASFYNLDFETAFQKIRSGISGETEPLKQLGINMSVVNLEAYAMTQGITKSFQEMSQGEQVMLRYQYLMQATADAQGDFARTSEGFANATRKLESQLDSLKAKLGGPIMQGLSEVLGRVSELVSALFPEDNTPRHTILDDFAEIDADRDERLSNVRATADAARALVTTLKDLESNGFRVTALDTFAEGANKLNSSSSSNWEAILGAFSENLPGFNTSIQNLPSPVTIGSLASALSGIDGAESKQQAWQTMLAALSENADGIAQMMNTDPQTVKDLLAGIASQASLIDENDAQAWDDLFTVFSTSFDNLITSTTLATLSQNIGGIAMSGNKLSASSGANWQNFLHACESIDGLSNIWSNTNLGGIDGLAAALATPGITTNRAAAWQTMLGAMKENIGTVAELHGDTEENTWDWLEGLATAANQLNPDVADGWDTLFSWLVQGLPGLNETPEGQALLNALTRSSNGESQVTQASSAAIDVMEMLGIATEDVTDQQSLWLAVCRELVRQIPSLSRIINTQTGEILGGAQAVEDYINAWEQESVTQIYLDALQAKIDEYNNLVREAAVNATAARSVVRSMLGNSLTIDASGSMFPAGTITQERDVDSLLESWSAWIREASLTRDAAWMMNQVRNTNSNGLWAEMASAYQAMNDRQKQEFERWIGYEADAGYNAYYMPLAAGEIQKAQQEYRDELERTRETLESVYGTIEDGDAVTVELTDEQVKAWQGVIDAVTRTASAVDEYQRKMIEATQQTLRSWGSVWDEVQTQDERTLQQLRESAEQNGDVEVDVRVGTNEIRSAQNMIANMTSRVARLAEYSALIQAAVNKGYSADVIAALSDGSLESLDILRAITGDNVSDAQRDQINDLYAQIGAAERDLAEQLSEYRLAADEEYSQLLDDFDEAMNALATATPTDVAANAVGQSIDWIITAIESRFPQLESDITKLQRALSDLNMFREASGYGAQITGGFMPGIGGYRVRYKGGVDGSFASGLDYVPRDGFIGELHRGESILPAQEARVWRAFKEGLDTNSIASAVWDNSPDMGGNVYLSGEIVGRIMSAAQADNYRQLERSGWRG